jgi:hypothetical protein
MALNGSPLAASTAVMPLIATRKPTMATVATVKRAFRETIPSTTWAADGDVATVFTTPS